MSWTLWIDTCAIYLAGAFVVFLPIELWRLARVRRLDRGVIREMLLSSAPLLPTLAMSGVTVSFITALYTWTASLRPWALPATPFSAVVCVVLVDFLYYVDHRAGHRVRAYWALAHSVHHSSPRYDQTTGFRVSFVDGFISPWFYLPAVLVGFSPELVAASLGLIIGYQQWLHTESIGKLGWFDRVFNSPSNHRVHHGSQAQYLDKNYGAILIIWDRIFGTYEPEREPPVYGLTQPLVTANPVTIHVAEAVRLGHALKGSRSLRERVALLCGPP